MIIRHDMKKLLILIVAAAVFLHFYPQPKLEKWALEKKEWLLEKFSSATDTRVRLNPKKVRSELEKKFGQFNENEREYVMEISSSRESIKAFYITECAKSTPSPKLHGTNKIEVCRIISKYQSLF